MVKNSLSAFSALFEKTASQNVKYHQFVPWF